MYRKQESYLQQWLKGSNKDSRKPLVIRGARQVGKSTLVRQFCKNNHIKLHEINLEKYPQLEAVFVSKDVNKIISNIEDILETKINMAQGSLLFLDEIQAVPSAFAALRYFYEDIPSLPVVAAGSLLEFLLNQNEQSVPVGRIQFLHMGPMTFEEFLIAKQENYFYKKILNLKSLEEINEGFHQKGLDLIRQFMFIGGMPEAISKSLESSMEEVSIVHSQILQTYQADFVKYAKKNHLQKIQSVFRYTFLHPCQKIKLSNISKDDLSRDLKFNLELLEQAKVISKVKHSNCAGLPLEASENENVYKLLTLDVGLMNHAQGLSWKSFKNYSENQIITEGIVAEQFVGQHLLYQRSFYHEPRLHYWLREGKSSNAEVDFIIEEDSNLVAIEVKSGVAGKIRSLHQWHLDISYKKKRAVRFNLSKGAIEQVSYQFKDKKLKYNLVSLPLYLIDYWKRFL